MNLVTLPRIREELKLGGSVVFTWGNSTPPRLVTHTGDRLPIDGRAYQGFTQTERSHPTCVRTEVGSTDEGNLVITWKLK